MSKDENWIQLDAEQQRDLRLKNQFATKPKIETSSSERIIDTLSKYSLSALQDSITAVASKVDKLLVLAAKCMEPDTVEIKLSSQVLTNEKEVDEWIEKAKSDLMNQVKQGHPVMPRM